MKVWHLSLGNIGLISEREKGKKMKVWHLSLGNVGLISEREKGKNESLAFELRKRRINKWKGKGRKEKVRQSGSGNVGL